MNEVPRALFQRPDVAVDDLLTPDYDVPPDRRFLIKVKSPNAWATQIHVITNWFEELKTKMGN